LLAKWRGSRAKGGELEGRTRAYELADPDPSWPAAFEREAATIAETLGDAALRIEHVGSTSVPGLAAKPVIDIQVSVASLIPRSAVVEPLVAMGYTHAIDPIETDHEFLSKEEGNAHSVHIHLCEAGGEWERRHLAFRDWLRAHPEDAAAYEALKRELAARHPRDIQTYVDGKTAFISSIEQRALSPT
jgi:GrpB-like predicted nucleotidyltransferase (UPF0157 family)